MFRDTGDAGDGGPSPESKTIPPDSLESWKEVLEKVGLSAALSTAFRDVYSGDRVANAASAKTFQEALSSPAEVLCVLESLASWM